MSVQRRDYGWARCDQNKKMKFFQTIVEKNYAHGEHELMTGLIMTWPG